MMFRRRRQRRVAILGCGPAGLFATHAFRDAGWDVTIFSKKRRSEMFGAQYLHKPIPGLPEITETVSYRLLGSPEQYALKVYGGAVPPGEVSPSLLIGEHQVWDIRAAYYAAWERYESLVINLELDAHEIPHLLSGFDHVMSSIPRQQICTAGHDFFGERIWAIGDAPERGVSCPVDVGGFTVICNGESHPAWYRASNVFGYRTAEWPGDSKPPIQDVAPVIKPIKTNCDCWEGKHFSFVGRFGIWKKGILSHQAYETAKEIVE